MCYVESRQQSIYFLRVFEGALRDGSSFRLVWRWRLLANTVSVESNYCIEPSDGRANRRTDGSFLVMNWEAVTRRPIHLAGRSLNESCWQHAPPTNSSQYDRDIDTNLDSAVQPGLAPQGGSTAVRLRTLRVGRRRSRAAGSLRFIVIITTRE